MKELTPKQEQFAREYLKDLNGKQAAIRAGYSEKTAAEQATRLLNNVHVAAFVQDRMDKRAERTEIDADYVLNGIKRVVERCEQVAPVTNKAGEPVLVETPDGNLVPAYTFEASAALKGYELLGKHLKLFADKVEHTGKDGAPINIVISKDDSELL